MLQGIMVFTDISTLEHKKRDGFKSDNAVCFWETRKEPKEFVGFSMIQGAPFLKKKFRLFFAVKGVIQGSFLVTDIHRRGDISELWFHSGTWRRAPQHGKTYIPSQGWRYFPVNESRKLRRSPRVERVS